MNLQDILATAPNLLSQPRFQRYLDATQNNPLQAMKLYERNLKLSAALYFPLHMAEISTRNAVADALQQYFGDTWHTSQALLGALSNPTYGYSPRRDLANTVRNLSGRRAITAGAVVAELNFVFWQKVLTRSFDLQVWRSSFGQYFPHAPAFPAGRAAVHDMVEQIRILRNRIAHHEPIYNRDLRDDYTKALTLVQWRDPDTAAWIDRNQKITQMLTNA